MKDEIKRCPECNAPLDWDMLTGEQHDRDICICRQLISAKAEIKKLKASVDAWKDAWFQLREIIGRLSWEHHNCPQEIQPPQDSKPNPWIHGEEPFVQDGELVWARITADYKLVGAGTSEEAAKAIIRLMETKE